MESRISVRDTNRVGPHQPSHLRSLGQEQTNWWHVSSWTVVQTSCDLCRVLKQGVIYFWRLKKVKGKGKKKPKQKPLLVRKECYVPSISDKCFWNANIYCAYTVLKWNSYLILVFFVQWGRHQSFLLFINLEYPEVTILRETFPYCHDPALWFTAWPWFSGYNHYSPFPRGVFSLLVGSETQLQNVREWQVF